MYNEAMERRILTGAEAVACAVELVKPEVIPVYPITPQTHIIEKLAGCVASGRLSAEFIRVESEMTAIGAVAGALVEGIRAFTATASQGLLFMHEVLHWIAGGRLPAVVAVCTRGVGAPWTLWCDMQDVLSQRDTGWMQVFASSAQEALDFLILAYKVAERCSIPAMVALDGFLISHTAEPLEVVDDEVVSQFLPPFEFELALKGEDPFTLWPIPGAEKYYRIRKELFEDHRKALDVWMEEFDRWYSLTGRRYSPVEAVLPENAKEAFVCVGALSGTVSHMIKNALLDEGVGLIDIKLFRPFPEELLRNAASSLDTVYVIDKAVSYGRSGILGEEVEAALRDVCQVKNMVGSLGGLDLGPERIVELYRRARDSREKVIWI